jgi:CPA1 family monovalent cation:H+ antiporter
LPPELILALFVAPVLLDAAYDTSLRDLRDNWRPVLSLVLVAVGLTTVAAAFTARQLLPDMPWAAAIALGALLAPGWLLARPVVLLIRNIEDAPSSVIFQFAITFGVWLAAERLGLSAVVTIVVFALTMAQRSAGALPAHLRVPSFAIWESATVVLNVLAFTLIGLQIRPILEPMSGRGANALPRRRLRHPCRRHCRSPHLGDGVQHAHAVEDRIALIRGGDLAGHPLPGERLRHRDP